MIHFCVSTFLADHSHTLLLYYVLPQSWSKFIWFITIDNNYVAGGYIYSLMGLHMVFHLSHKLTIDKLVYAPIKL